MIIPPSCDFKLVLERKGNKRSGLPIKIFHIIMSYSRSVGYALCNLVILTNRHYGFVISPFDTFYHRVICIEYLGL